MSVDNIIAKITKDAEEEAAKIIAVARQKADETKSRLLKDAGIKAKELAGQAQLDIEEIKRRQSLIAELENRKSILSVRRGVLDEVFKKAEQKINELPEDKWEALMTRYILEVCETGEETLCVPEKDRAKYQNGFLAKLNQKIQAEGKKGALTLSDKNAGFSGGVLVEGKDGDYDASFTAILKNVRTEYERETAQMLFPAEVH